MMEYEKTIRLDDGRRVNLRIETCTYYSAGDKKAYNLYTTVCEKGKRTFNEVYDKDCYKYRGLSMPDRESSRRRIIVKLVGIEQIELLFSEFHEIIKPDICKTCF